MTIRRAPFLVALMALLPAAQASDGYHYRKTLNPRRQTSQSTKQPRRPSRARKKPPRAFAGKPARGAGSAGEALRPGRWRPEVRSAIDALIRGEGRLSPRYDRDHPPAAVLNWDDGAVWGDSAFAVFLSLDTSAAFRFSDEFWDVVPIVFGRQPMRSDVEQFRALPQDIWRLQPSYLTYRKMMVASYLDMCSRVSRKECRVYLARLLTGLREKAAESLALRVWDAETGRPRGFEEIKDSLDDPEPIKVPRGLRVIPEIADLVSRLRGNGFDVWIVADSPEPEMRSLVSLYGVDPSRAVGIGLESRGGVLSSKVREPVPYRAGKVAIIEEKIGRRPRLVVGGGEGDMDILGFSGGLSVFLDSGDKALAKRARARGWLMQPAFGEISRARRTGPPGHASRR